MQIFVPWVHILSFSIWLSANLFVLGMVWPASRSLPAGERLDVMRRAARGLNLVVAAAAPLAVLSGLGGLFLPGASAQVTPGSGVFLLLVAKAILTSVMAVNHGLQAFRYHDFPEHPGDSRHPWTRLLTANLILGIIVLLLGLGMRRVAM